MIRNVTFSGGVKPNYYKGYTENKAIERAIIPEYVHVPLLQGSGVTCSPIVDLGDKVKIGQKIADLEGSFGACVHASISGEVTEISERYTDTGKKVNCITIKSDGRDEKVEFIPRFEADSISVEEMVEISKEAGIIGMGGAGFPFGMKLSSSLNIDIDSVLANGAECEPFITSSDRVMVEFSKELIQGIELTMNVVKAEKAYFVIEDNKEEAIRVLDEKTKDNSHLTVVATETKYPQGYENFIVDAVLDREVKLGELVGSQGAFVSNVETFKALSDAVYLGKPSYERVITITGPGIKEPKNLMARIGTPIGELINQCGGFTEDDVVIIFGGPMTGSQSISLDMPVSKKTTGIVVLTKDYLDLREESPCIKCGRCIEACPFNLNPSQINAAIVKENFQLARDLNAEACKICGACSYICPAKRNLTESIQMAIGVIRTKLN